MYSHAGHLAVGVQNKRISRNGYLTAGSRRAPSMLRRNPEKREPSACMVLPYSRPLFLTLFSRKVIIKLVCCRREQAVVNADASRGVTTPSREGPLDRRGGPLLECVGCPAGALSILVHLWETAYYYFIFSSNIYRSNNTYRSKVWYAQYTPLYHDPLIYDINQNLCLVAQSSIVVLQLFQALLFHQLDLFD